MSADAPPLVTIGMPVRNGGQMFRSALASVVEQDYPSLEIIVSDNCSTDETVDIVREFQGRRTIRYVRQEKLLTAFDNFQWVLREARGEYFAWAAHDDLRSINFVSELRRKLDTEPSAVLAFCTLEIMNVFGEDGKVRKDYDYATPCVASRFARMRKQANMQCYHIYGLWRTKAAKGIPKLHTAWWPDLPIMVCAAWMGQFVHADGAVFRYYEVPKTDAQRVAYQDNAANAGLLTNVLSMLWTLTRTVNRLAGPFAAIAALVFGLEKITGFAAEWIARRWR